jgi:Ca2+-binding RTX toxin-like protein
MKARAKYLANGRDDAGQGFDFVNVGAHADAAQAATAQTLADGADPHGHGHDDNDHPTALILSSGGGGPKQMALRMAPKFASADLSVAGAFDTGAPAYAVAALVGDEAWSVTTINYAFMDAPPAYLGMIGFEAFSKRQEKATVEILDMIAQYTPLTFQETEVSKSHIALGSSNFGPGAGGYGWHPDGDAVNSVAGDVLINNFYSSQSNAKAGNFAYMSLLHEIGHALGLEHPHEGILMPVAEDSRQYTVESYNGHGKMARVEPQSFMSYDIAALQSIYGVNQTWAVGNDVYDYSTANKVIETIWDAGGTDTLTAAGSSVGAVIDLNAGCFSSVGLRGKKPAVDNIAIAFGTVIENAVGTAHADLLIGNAVKNVLTGLAGNDRLIGGAAQDVFVFAFGSGVDRIEDFQVNADQIDLRSTGLDYAELEFSQGGDGAWVAFGTDRVLLVDVAVGQLDPGDFLLA